MWFEGEPHGYGHQLAFVANLLTAAMEAEPPTFDRSILGPRLPEVVGGSLHVAGNLEIAGRLVVCGDLTVSGDCGVGPQTVVCGDLDINGRWTSTDEYGHHAICGDVRVGEAFLVQGETFVTSAT